MNERDVHTSIAEAERNKSIQELFTRIARHYDWVNIFISGGQDVHWRREVIQRAALPCGGKLLDLGAGTGKLAHEALRSQPTCQVLAVDYTIEMIRVGKEHSEQRPMMLPTLTWCIADAEHLPFPDDQFDAVVSGFLLRNLGNLQKSIAEQYRVLKPGGRFVSLDTTPPLSKPWAFLTRLYLRIIVPILGWILSGDYKAYQYLRDTTEGFLPPQQLAIQLQKNGFQEIGFRCLSFGAIAIHWGNKPI